MLTSTDVEACLEVGGVDAAGGLVVPRAVDAGCCVGEVLAGPFSWLLIDGKMAPTALVAALAMLPATLVAA